MDAVIVETPVPSRLIEGAGTGEQDWAACGAFDRLPTLDPRRMAQDHGAIWIVSPHPDDEVLALGGFLAALTSHGADLRIVSVTNGTASHVGSRHWTAAMLAEARPRELRQALATLGIEATITALDLPDGAVGQHAAAIVDHLVARCASDHLVIAPWRFDGHPDHEACSRAGAIAARVTGATFAEYPVWAWHWARPDDPSFDWSRARRMPMTADVLSTKRTALRSFTSQITPDDGRDAILPAHVLARFERDFELLFVGP